MTTQHFKAIGIQGHSVGQLLLNEDEMHWTSRDGEVHKRLAWDKTEGATWAFFGRYGHLRLLPSDGSHPVRLDGFSKLDFNARGVELTKEKINCGGGNYGQFEIGDHGTLRFRGGSGGERDVFALNLKDVSQCVLPGNNRKGNDVELQFHESDAMDNQAEDALVEMRLCLPAGEAGGDDEPSAAEQFQEQVMERANIRDVKGAVLVEFDRDQGTFLTPRGRYTIEMYGGFMRMHGSKYDYKIQYDDINRLYLLEKPDDRYWAFVISLDKPIRQGQQRYQHLVLQTTSEQREVQVHMKEDELRDKYAGALMPLMEGPMNNLIAKIFKALSNRTVYVTGKFRSVAGAKSVACALGANDGQLYPLNKSFIFIHKPTRIIGFDEIESVEFQRYGGAQGTGATRNFDLCVSLASVGGEPRKEFIFSGIDRAEYQGLESFLSTKKLNIKSIQEGPSGSGVLDIDMEEHDPYKEQAVASAAGGGDDDESEEDDDYAPNSGKESSAEEKSSGSESEGSDAPPKKSKKEKPPQKKRKPAADEDSPPAKKSKPKAAAKPKPKPAAKPKPASDDDGSDDDDEGSEDEKPKAKAKGKGRAPAKGGKGGGGAAVDKPKKKRAKKDPDAPKGALSAFMQFSKAKRGELMKDHPDWKVTDAGRALGELWRALDKDERKPFDEAAATDKERYKKEMAKYNAKKASGAKAEASEDSGDHGGGGGGGGDDSDSD